MHTFVIAVNNESESVLFIVNFNSFFQLHFRFLMALKLPLPITRRITKHQTNHAELDGIPNFTKYEFSDVQMIGQGTF